MAPQGVSSPQMLNQRMVEVTKPTDPTGLILEAWAQGYMVGSIIIMICITVSNIKRKILLHKLILLEVSPRYSTFYFIPSDLLWLTLCQLVLGILHGTFIFNNPPIYGWYLSVTATFLIISWSLHNAVAWIKTRPFLSRRTSIIFIVTVALVQPYWALEIYADFTYFNNINDIYLRTRVFEALFRDPWWVYTTCCLLYSIRTCYHFGFFEFMRISPRFAIMILAMILSIIFTVLDICAVTGTLKEALPIGINPFWKLAFVFRLLADSVILDDFKTALDKLSHYNLSRIEDQWGDDWASSNNRRVHRERSEPTVPPDVTIAGWRRPETNESAGSWVGVRTEIKVESFPMK